eukprot:TRINITY_DN703_c0_g1_i1.p1 TRINITY_DN703_c0_g1~~TRINITY_DN703_c0_g1_i1.p1  ORF type:complete len:170 (+),score=25.22 TRINITY_DN703_c0_g1_i1:32-511(+)
MNKLVFSVALLCVFGAVYAQQQDVVVYAGNSFEPVCAFTGFVQPYTVNSVNASGLWSNADNRPIYVPANNSLIFECADPVACTHYTFATIIYEDSVSLTNIESQCFISYIENFNTEPLCYVEWICGPNYKPALRQLREDAAEIANENSKRVADLRSRLL